MKGRGHLRTAELAVVAEAALLNSLSLLEDAELLAAGQRWPRAFAVAVLAGEEFGKLMMCLGALGNPRADSDDYWDEFWRRFLGHKPKAENIFQMAATFIDDEEVARGFREQATEHVKADQDQKMAGLYVDYTDKGLSVPWVRVNQSDVEAALSVYGMVIRSWAEAVGPGSAQKMVDAESEAVRLQQARATGDLGEIERVLRDQLGTQDEG